MELHRNLVRLAAVLLLFGLGLVGQTMTIDPQDIIPPGGKAKISYADASKAGQIIVVTITGGAPPSTQTLQITLDANGNGSATWTAPADWSQATFSAPSVSSQTVLIG
jgi:hypothetical protein